jgi:hypothetical protein
MNIKILINIEIYYDYSIVIINKIKRSISTYIEIT